MNIAILSQGLLSRIVGPYLTHVPHTATISNDERLLCNDTDTNCKVTKLFTKFICDMHTTNVHVLSLHVLFRFNMAVTPDRTLYLLSII